MIAIDRWHARVVQARGAAPAKAHSPWPYLRGDLADIRLQIYCENLTDRMGEEIEPLSKVDRFERLELVKQLVHGARSIGLRADKSVERYCIASILIVQPAETDARFHPIVQSGEHELDR